MIGHAQPVLLWARMQWVRDGRLSNGTQDWPPTARSEAAAATPQIG
jgi:hypothetical protein